MNSDQALRLLGRYNAWQIRSYMVFASAFGLIFGWMKLIIIFVGDTPRHRCILPFNSTEELAIPSAEDATSSELSSCTMYNYTTDIYNYTTYTNQTIGCDQGYWFDPQSGYESTIVSEWNLVCGKGWLVELAMGLSNLGSIFGAQVFLPLSDSLGRRPVFLFCLGIDVLVTIIQAFSPNMTFFTVMAFIDGVFQTGLAATSAVLAVELFPIEGRSFAGINIEMFWAIAYITIVGFAYFIRSWRYLQLAATLCLTLTFIYYWLAPESIPWLVNNGRYDEAEKILRNAIGKKNDKLPKEIFPRDEPLLPKEERKITCTKVSKALIVRCRKNDSGLKSYTVREIFGRRTLLKNAIIMAMVWFVNAMSYYALAYSVTLLPGDRYFNSFFYGLQEIPAYLLSWLLAHKIGRRIPLSVSHLISAAAMFGVAIMEFDFVTKIDWLIITFSQIGKFFVTMNFAFMYLYTPEIYPTNFRTTGMAFHVTCGKVAQLFAPFARTLNRSHPMIPPTFMCAICLVTGILVPLLPETRYEPLPETIEDVELLGKRKPNKLSFVADTETTEAGTDISPNPDDKDS